MPIPTEVFGSLHRPECTPPVYRPLLFNVFITIDSSPEKLTGSITCLDLQSAYADYDAGKNRKEDLIAAQNKAAEDSVTRMIDTGGTLVMDGERRASSFTTYPVIDTLGGDGLASNLAANRQYFTIFDDGHHRKLPRWTSNVQELCV